MLFGQANSHRSTLGLLALFRFLQPIQTCLGWRFSQCQSCYITLSIKDLLCQSIHAMSCLVCLTLWQISQSPARFEDKGAETLLLLQPTWRIDLQAIKWGVSGASPWPWHVFSGVNVTFTDRLFLQASSQMSGCDHPGNPQAASTGVLGGTIVEFTDFTGLSLSEDSTAASVWNTQRVSLPQQDPWACNIEGNSERYKMANLHEVMVHTRRVPEVEVSTAVGFNLFRSQDGPFLGFQHFCCGISRCYLAQSPCFSLWWVFSHQEVGRTSGCWAVADADRYLLSGPESAFPVPGWAQGIGGITQN